MNEGCTHAFDAATGKCTQCDLGAIEALAEVISLRALRPEPTSLMALLAERVGMDEDKLERMFGQLEAMSLAAIEMQLDVPGFNLNSAVCGALVPLVAMARQYGLPLEHLQNVLVDVYAASIERSMNKRGQS